MSYTLVYRSPRRPVSIGAPADPWAALDGRLNAPAGTPQYPTLLNGYAARPPWQVAGVHYYVGPAAGTVFTDPNDGLPAGAAIGGAPWRVEVSGANVTLENYDMSQGQATVALYINNGANNLIVRNCKLKFTQCQPGNDFSNALFENCVFDTGGDVDQDWQAGFFGTPSGLTFRYCVFQNASSDFLQCNASVSDILFEYCLFDTAGIAAGKHPDYTQFLGGVTGTNGFRMRFCTSRQGAAASGTQGFMCELNAGTVSAGEYAYNTFTPGGNQPSFILGFKKDQLVGTFRAHHNYYDDSGATVFVATRIDGLSALPGDDNAFSVFDNNVDMITGLPGNND